MRISYSEVEAVVRSVHGSGAKPTALLGRLKYLQRLNWPPGGAKGQGSRAGYGLEQLLALMAACELLELGLPPMRVVRLLRTGWDTTLRALIIGWASAFGGARPVFLALAPKALEDLGVPEDEARPSPDRMLPVARSTLDYWAENYKDGAPALYVTDPRRVVAAMRAELAELGIMHADAVDRSFSELGSVLFEVNEPLIWQIDGVRPD